MVQTGYFLTNRTNADFELSNFHSLLPVLLPENHNKPLLFRMQAYGKMSTFMRLITFVLWLSNFTTSTVSRHSVLHLKCRSTSVCRGMFTSWYCHCTNCHFDLITLTADYVCFFFGSESLPLWLPVLRGCLSSSQPEREDS